MPRKVLANATRLGYAGNAQLTVFSIVSIFWPYDYYRTTTED